MEGCNLAPQLGVFANVLVVDPFVNALLFLTDDTSNSLPCKLPCKKWDGIFKVIESFTDLL